MLTERRTSGDSLALGIFSPKFSSRANAAEGRPRSRKPLSPAVRGKGGTCRKVLMRVALDAVCSLDGLLLRATGRYEVSNSWGKNVTLFQHVSGEKSS